MRPTGIPIAFALCLTILLACLALYSGTTRVGPLLGQGPFDVQVGAIILVCVGATAGIAWSIHAMLRRMDEGSNRASLQSATLTAAIVGMLMIATIAALGTVNPLAAGMVALLMILASVAALRCFDSLAQGRALGFESHWGGLGGGGGGWRLLPATALALLALSFTGAAVMIAFGELKQPAPTSPPAGNGSAADKAAPATDTTPANAAAPATAANETAPAAAPSPVAASPALPSKPKLPPPPRPQSGNASGSVR